MDYQREFFIDMDNQESMTADQFETFLQSLHERVRYSGYWLKVTEMQCNRQNLTVKIRAAGLCKFNIFDMLTVYNTIRIEQLKIDITQT